MTVYDCPYYKISDNICGVSGENCIMLRYKYCDWYKKELNEIPIFEILFSTELCFN